jgi:hypothetical protein
MQVLWTESECRVGYIVLMLCIVKEGGSKFGFQGTFGNVWRITGQKNII